MVQRAAWTIDLVLCCLFAFAFWRTMRLLLKHGYGCHVHNILGCYHISDAGQRSRGHDGWRRNERQVGMHRSLMMLLLLCYMRTSGLQRSSVYNVS